MLRQRAPRINKAYRNSIISKVHKVSNSPKLNDENYPFTSIDINSLKYFYKKCIEASVLALDKPLDLVLMIEYRNSLRSFYNFSGYILVKEVIIIVDNWIDSVKAL